MCAKRGSESAIAEIIKLGQGIKVSEMAAVTEAAEKAGGALIGVDPENDDQCGTGVLRFKWPPKKDEFLRLLDTLVASRINHEIIINGIPVPDEILLQVTRRRWV